MKEASLKKLIRFIIKVPATPFVSSYFVLLILGYFIVKFFEWLYDASSFDKYLTHQLYLDQLQSFKRWFTTL
jgi:hypothetical protein